MKQKIIPAGTNAIYTSTINGLKIKCVVAKDTPADSKLIVVDLLDELGNLKYSNMSFSKDNISF